MSVQSEIQRIKDNIAGAYAAVADKGGTVPAQPNSDNLPAAVASIPDWKDKISGIGVSTVQAMTEAEYNALTAKSSTVLYVIREG